MGAAGESLLSRARLRGWLSITGISVTFFGVLHHVDHVVRGNYSG